MPEREGHLCLHVVDAIDGEIAVCEIIRQRLRQEPLSVGVDGERWVDLSEALSTGISTLSTAAVMALGILFVSTLSRGITYFRKTKSTGR